jgi:sigma-B regulation protein RsbU (phosphoserine phosphatase)
VRGGGDVERLRAGGPVIGLLDEADYEEGAVDLRPGDLLAVVTDGVTEALSPDEEEFGDRRVCESLRGVEGSAHSALRRLVQAVEEWTRPAEGFGDDLTAVIMRAK